VIGFALRLAVSAAVLAVILVRVPFNEVFARAFVASPLYLAAALGLAAGAIVLVALRWRALAASLGLAIPRALAVRALFLGVFGGQVLPSAIGVDVVRGWLVSRHTVGVPHLVATLIGDRLVALFAACLLVLYSYPRLGTAAALACGALLAALIVTMRRRVQVDLYGLPVALALALASHLLAVAIAMAAAHGYGVDASFALWIAVIPVALVVSAIPVSLNGWGLREATIVALAAPLGIAPADALLVSMTIGLLNALASLPGAIVLLQDRRRRLA
jgi:glycosyltransferase 2 family protein